MRLVHALVMEAATVWLRGEASHEAVEAAVLQIERGLFAVARDELGLSASKPPLRRRR
ncbi:MAG TPA: hypothetical protein VMR31_14230 [Myxococcota bacterium]|nr:hypothetical protein [Myxococcota bacterium]